MKLLLAHAFMRPFLVITATLALTALAWVPRASAAPLNLSSSLTTGFNSNNGGDNGGAVYFDVNVLHPSGVTFTSIDSNINSSGVNGFLGVYTTAKGGTYVGNHSNPVWTLVSSGQGISTGIDNPTSVDIADFTLEAGRYGFALVASPNWGHRYTNGTGSNQFFSNADLELTLGAATNISFAGSAFSPRVWNGTLHYTPVPGPLPVFGAVGGFAWSRKLRKRLKDSRSMPMPD